MDGRRVALLLPLLLVLDHTVRRASSAPRFDPTALLRDVLVPVDAAVGSVVYRLRASDPTFDYPLEFRVARGVAGVVAVDGLNCTRFNSVCQANVILKRRLEPDRYYDFTVEVTSQRGEAATLNCSIRATNATTPVEKIFPGAPSLLTVSESARRNTELGTILAKGNPNGTRPVLLELWGSPEFGLHQRLVTERDAEGTILLLSNLDYEKKTVHHLTVLANDPWTNMAEDTRNIAGWPLLVAVLDEQDTPPVFTIAPPTTILGPNLRPGDLVLRVHAEDGDKGDPREIRYGLVPDEGPFVKFFDMDDETGELHLSSPISDIVAMSHSGQPILITVTAEEVRSNADEAPAQSATVQLAIIPPGVTAGLPTFGAIEYNALIDENSPTGTVLDLAQAEVNTQPGDIVTLELMNNNGTFDISPSAVEGNAVFKVTVHDPKLLDYEQRQSVQCYILAKEVGAGNYTAKAKLTVVLKDVNDNPPAFSAEEYHASVQEHSAVGTNVLVVEASDIDTGLGGKIKFTGLTGRGSQLFALDPDSGLVTVADPVRLDAETTPIITVTVQAADENGQGLTATATIVVNLVDINDNEPEFDKAIYEFILDKDKSSFTIPAVIRATDKDASQPNNEVFYEIINMPEHLYLNERTGEVLVRKTWDLNDVMVLGGRAWDGGVPRRYGECEIRIYPPENRQGKVVFIIPGQYRDKESVGRTLRNLTRNRIVSIDRIRPYNGNEPGATDITSDYDKEKTVVEATVTYSKGSIVDLSDIGQFYQNRHEDTRFREKEIVRIQESRSDGLLWFLVLFFVLLLLAIIALILCCLCKQCPFYSYFVHKKRTPHIEEKIERVQIIGSGHGKESKSVQATDRTRREAWSPPDHQAMDHSEAESLRRYEFERGSDREEARRRQTLVQSEPPREQLYFREGNADILRLITRGEQRPIHEPYDSGKDILMQRFMEQQQAQQILLPNAVNRLQTEHELLEASLRQQNAMLRQILLDRERDLRLETQSLPAGTQTDQDAGTQTEPQFATRKVQSDNDHSEASEDDEIAMVKARAKRRNGQRTYHVRRKIKTPIQEEVELEIVEKPRTSKPTERRPPKYRHTKTSEMRRKRVSSEARSSHSSKSGLRKDVLKEISASLERSDDEYYNNNEIFSEDSLEISPRSSTDKTSDSNRQRYHSESDLRRISARRGSEGVEESVKREKVKSQSHADLTKLEKGGKKVKGSGSRYMEWYTKTQNDKKQQQQPQQVPRKGSKSSITSRLPLDAESISRKKSNSKKSGNGPDHPLLQHSERRFEPQQQQPRRPEEDADSGIALSRPQIAQKKSVFTIAYDDMRTSQLRPDSTTLP